MVKVSKSNNKYTISGLSREDLERIIHRLADGLTERALELSEEIRKELQSVK